MAARFQLPEAALSAPTSVAASPPLPVHEAPESVGVSFDDLDPVEQAAASLGVHPKSLQPISWLNNAHFDQLKKNNALDATLERRIAAYKLVSTATENVTVPSSTLGH